MQERVPKADGLVRRDGGDASSCTASATPGTDNFGRQCLLARRFVEAGVRFVEVCTRRLGPAPQSQGRLPKNCQAVDRPIAGLLTDLKAARPAQGHAGHLGRRVRPHALRPERRRPRPQQQGLSRCGWPAAASRAASPTARPTSYGYEAVEDKVHIHDWHATILHLLGLDHEKLTYPLRRPRHAAHGREGRCRQGHHDLRSPRASGSNLPVYVSRPLVGRGT